jgi:hypothetical protein
VFDAYLGGYPVMVLGVESRPMPRRGNFPADGPDQWTAGTLTAVVEEDALINSASNRPLVVLANLSGLTDHRSRCANCSWDTAPRSAVR